MKILLIVLLFLAGCTNPESLSYVQFQEHKAHAEILQQRASILTLYRTCLEQYQHDPPQAKAQCEHYTQALYSLDIGQRSR